VTLKLSRTVVGLSCLIPVDVVNNTFFVWENGSKGQVMEKNLGILTQIETYNHKILGQW